jgi:hypothetical protein
MDQRYKRAQKQETSRLRAKWLQYLGVFLSWKGWLWIDCFLVQDMFFDVEYFLNTVGIAVCNETKSSTRK